MKPKLCVATGSRAEYGLLQPLMKALKASDAFELQVLVTGMHLSPEFGNTYQVIEAEGFVINEKVEMLLSSDTDRAIAKSVGLGMITFADALYRLNPDLLIILGDRFEIFAVATAAYLAKIPIAHLHGGEVTEGATDEALRHSISKMAYWHFTSTEEYRQRVIQLGENPSRVFNVGAIGIDNIKELPLLSKETLENQLNIHISKPFLLITYHPVTLENQTAAQQFHDLLTALNAFEELYFIFTKPNADANGRVIIGLIDSFVAENPHKSSAFVNLGQLRYLSLMQYAKAVVGNSSSGIIEAPSMGIPTVNIGDRQAGRVRADSVIDTPTDTTAMVKAIEKALSTTLQAQAKKVENPYGKGNTTERIMTILHEKTIPKNLKKAFYRVGNSETY